MPEGFEGREVTVAGAPIAVESGSVASAVVLGGSLKSRLAHRFQHRHSRMGFGL